MKNSVVKTFLFLIVCLLFFSCEKDDSEILTPDEKIISEDSKLKKRKKNLTMRRQELPLENFLKMIFVILTPLVFLAFQLKKRNHNYRKIIKKLAPKFLLN